MLGGSLELAASQVERVVACYQHAEGLLHQQAIFVVLLRVCGHCACCGNRADPS